MFAHSVGEGVPRFLAFVELSILRHVAYAYGVLPSICSLCGEGGGEHTAVFLCLLNFSNEMPYALDNLPCG